jgi:cell wall-associated NlpC family hydrolase
MTITDALSRIAQIQSTLVQLDNPTGLSSTSGTGSTTSTDSATDFAAALSSAVGTSGATGATDAGSLLGGGTVTGADVVADAKKYLGVPYVFGGTTSSGLDCSGLVQRVYKDLGIDVPRLVSGQAKLGTEVPSLAEAKPGDLIVTGGGEHILIYAGDHKVIHAPREGKNVSLVEAYMDDSDIDTIRRVVPETASTAAPAFSAASFLSSASGGASGLLGSSGTGTGGVSADQAAMLRALFSSMLSGGSA